MFIYQRVYIYITNIFTNEKSTVHRKKPTAISGDKGELVRVTTTSRRIYSHSAAATKRRGSPGGCQKWIG